MTAKRKRMAIAAIAGLAIAAAVGAGALLLRRAQQPRFDMVKELARIADAEGVWDNQWDQHNEKIAELAAALKNTSDPFKAFQLKREIGHQSLFAGSIEASIAIFEEMEKELGKTLPLEATEAVKSELAFAYFRLGEVENCTATAAHNPDSCLFPIEGKGIHQRRLGAQESVRLYGELLDDPKTNAENALAYRWLLNIGSMTLGQYPEKVPKRWLIPPDAFKSDADIGRFPDVAARSGIAEFGIAGGLILEDFDNDGHLDAMISHMGIRDQIQYFHGNGDGTFTRMTDRSGLLGITGGLNMVQADFDNDGCIDVLLLRGAWMHDHGRYPPSLLKNNCDNTFTDVTAKAGLLSYYPTQTGTWADVDGDGRLDLFIGYEIDREHVEWPKDTPNFRLYHNNGDGTFTEVGAASGIQLDGMVKAAVFGDYDNDGKPDLFVSILNKPNRLFHNITAKGGPLRFEDVTKKAGVSEPIASFSTWFFDYDNDGWPDIFVSGYNATLPNVVREYIGQKAQAVGDRPRLYHNNHDGTFTDKSREAHLDQMLLTMGSNFGDLDNDGWLDFYLGTGAPSFLTLVPNRMFRNDGGRSFQDVTASGGFGNLQKGHGVAFGDIFETGNQDILEVMGGAFSGDRFWTSLYKNPGHGNHWVKLRLTGTKANRFGLGARIRIVTSGDGGGAREIYSTVSSGGDFGASSLRPHLGLAKATSIDLIEVRWPGSGTLQQFKGPIPADRTYEIREDSAELKDAGVRLSAVQAKK